MIGITGADDLQEGTVEVENSNELELDCSQEFNSVIDSFVHIGSAAHPIKSKVMRPENLLILFNELTKEST